MNRPGKGSCPSSSPLLEETIFVVLLKAADSLSQPVEQLFKSRGLTSAQYNVLRILRGAEPGGLPCSAVGERMISHDPDMTRMLDRMEKRGWITRARETEDRRVVRARITDEGLKVLRKLDQPVRELHNKRFAHMSPQRLKVLGELLEEIGHRESA